MLRCEWHGTQRWPIIGLVLVPRIVQLARDAKPLLDYGWSLD